MKLILGLSPRPGKKFCDDVEGSGSLSGDEGENSATCGQSPKYTREN